MGVLYAFLARGSRSVATATRKGLKRKSRRPPAEILAYFVRFAALFTLPRSFVKQAAEELQRKARWGAHKIPFFVHACA
jgi:hypothetical protein